MFDKDVYKKLMFNKDVRVDVWYKMYEELMFEKLMDVDKELYWHLINGLMFDKVLVFDQGLLICNILKVYILGVHNWLRRDYFSIWMHWNVKT